MSDFRRVERSRNVEDRRGEQTINEGKKVDLPQRITKQSIEELVKRLPFENEKRQREMYGASQAEMFRSMTFDSPEVRKAIRDDISTSFRSRVKPDAKLQTRDSKLQTRDSKLQTRN
jgi:hypothetical protein